MKNLLVAFICLTCMTSFSQEVKKRQITPAQIDAVFSQWDTPDKPGIAVGVLNDGEIVYTQGYGLANLEHNILITPETKFHIGGLAKEFTVYAILLLEQRGQLSLESDIRKYIPKLASLPQSISILQLLHHTSGLNSMEVSKTLAGWKPEDVFTKKQAYAIIHNQVKTADISTTEQRFSEAGFMILEDLIAQISKVPYPEFVIKEIFEPLGMNNTLFDSGGTLIPQKAQGYLAQHTGFTNATMNQNHSIISNVYTTVEDMCFWAKELGNPKIGTQQMLEKFDGLSIVNQKKIKEENTAYYTGGHRFWNFRGAKKLYHVEVGGGYASKLIRYPDYNLAVVIMGNDGAYNGSAGTAASELYIEDFLNPMASNTTASEIASKKLSRKQLAAFEGNYWDLNSYNTRKIHMVNDTLRYFRGTGNESALVPLNKNSFKMITWGDVNVSFDAKAAPKKMNVIVGDDTFNLLEFDENANWTKNLDAFTGNYYAEVLDTFYAIVLKEGKLVIRHPRLEPVQLDPKIPNVFSGSSRHFSSLTFKRTANGTISGFQLATQGVENLWFQKEKTFSNKVTKAK